MRITTRPSTGIRSTLTTTTAIAVALLASAETLAFSGGAPEGFTASPASGGMNCILCHASEELNSGPGSIEVLDLPALYVPDKIYTLRVRVQDVTKVGAGFELSVENPAGAHIGELEITDPVDTMSAGGLTPLFITHTTSGKATSIADWTALGSAAEFTVQWKAPADDAGEIGFYAAGIAINNGTASSNDNAYTTAVTRTAAGSGDLNGDGAVDSADLGLLITAFGTANEVADLNNDSMVDATDLSIIISAFGS